MTNLLDILDKVFAAGKWNAGVDINPDSVLVPSEAQAAIAELVEGCLPKEIDYRGNGSEWNDCLKEIRNNLIKAGVLNG